MRADASILWGLHQQHLHLVDFMRRAPKMIDRPVAQPVWWQATEVVQLLRPQVAQPLAELGVWGGGIAATTGAEPEWVQQQIQRSSALELLISAAKPTAPRWDEFPPITGWHFNLVSESLLAAANPSTSSAYVLYRLGKPKQNSHTLSHGGSRPGSGQNSVGGMLSSALGSGVMDAVEYLQHVKWRKTQDTAAKRIAYLRWWADDWVNKVPAAKGYIEDRFSRASMIIWDSFAGKPNSIS